VISIVVVTLAIGACGDEADHVASTSSTACGSGDRYFVFQDSAWELKEAVDYPDDLGPLASTEPDLDWYAESERFVPLADSSIIEGQNLRLSGHESGLDDHAAQLLGADLSETQVGERRALVGTGADGKPALLTIEVGPDYTLMLLSYELDPAELVDAAARLDAVCQAEWVAAGGEMVDCVPAEPDCEDGT
jgi:hypothetical protein